MTKVRDREQLIDAAAKVFAEKGFEAARLEDIAAELGILKGSLYHYISSKVELHYLVRRRRLLTIIERVEGIVASDARPLDKLAAAVRTHLHYLDDVLPEAVQWFVRPPRERVRGDRLKDLQQLDRRYIHALEDILREGIACEEFGADLDIRLTAYAILGMCNWLPHWYRKGGRLPIDDISDRFIRLLIDGVRLSAQGTDGVGVTLVNPVVHDAAQQSQVMPQRSGSPPVPGGGASREPVRRQRAGLSHR